MQDGKSAISEQGSFTDMQPRVVDDYYLGMNWGGQGRQRFHCYLCGHHFELGDIFRWQAVNGPYINLFVCVDCDGPDVVDRWMAFVDGLREKGWQIDHLGARYD